MRINIHKDDAKYNKLIKATQISTTILKQIAQFAQIGKSLIEINDYAGYLCEQHNVIPAFIGQQSDTQLFSSNLCVSVNDTVLHGVPNNYVLKLDDVLKLDFGIIYEGIYTDHCITTIITHKQENQDKISISNNEGINLSSINQENVRLVKTTKLAVETGVSKAVAGGHTGDIGHGIQTIVEAAGFNVLKEFVGHGIGNSLHEKPEIAAYGSQGKGEILNVGDIICVEAQVVAGKDTIYIDEDGWSVKTIDKSYGAMFEYMVCVTGQKPYILTQTQNWSIYSENL